MSFRSGGVKSWVMQRLSAVYIAVFLSFFLFSLFTSTPTDFTQWNNWLALPLINVAFIIFWIAVIVHAWIGARDVIMDYVHDDTLRFLVLSMLGMFLIFMLVWVIKVLIMVSTA